MRRARGARLRAHRRDALHQHQRPQQDGARLQHVHFRKERAERRGHRPRRRGLHVLDHREPHGRGHDLRAPLRPRAPLCAQRQLQDRLVLRAPPPAPAPAPALALLELCSVAQGVFVHDVALKRAAARVEWARVYNPGKYALLLRGGEEEVAEALAAARAAAGEFEVDALLLPSPHAELLRALER
ncbi:MAG: BMC domain-containing protein, partial [Deltaproteobacteria bacterium]|nr:BMC domain-containing protein [Deltaproteobacteria bacterium]